MGASGLAPRMETVVLFQGHDLTEIRRLREAVDSAIAQSTTTALGEDPVGEAAKAHDDFVTQATERAVHVEMTKVGRKVMRDMVAKHPPRDDHERDKVYGFNEETLGDDLVPACIVGPEFAKSEAFLDDLSQGEFQRLYAAAFRLNVDASDDPKADLSSRLALTSDAT